jgi:TolA-binding protein
MDPIDGLEALGRRVAQVQVDSGATEAERAFLRERFLAAVRAARRRRIRLRVLGGLALSAAAALAVFLLHHSSLPDLDFSVDGAPGRVGEFLQSPDDRAIDLKFTEGTSAVLTPRTRGRVTALSPYGADVVIETGKAKMSVVPRARNLWTVHAGPFVVHVTGTRFEVAWDPVKDRFVLELHEGKVKLSGCVFGDGSEVAAGERVEAGCGLAEVRVSRLQAPGNPHEESPPDPAAQASAAAAAAATARPDWLAMARAGRYAEAYRIADAEGIEDLCAKSSANSLLLLGDAARLSGHPDTAHSAYLGVRSRFSGTKSAASAAFYLGRLDQDARHDSSAKKWYLAYLDEFPDGPLAAAALGRLLEIQIASHGSQSAVGLAKQYQARYPGGPHSATAEHVLTDSSSHVGR